MNPMNKACKSENIETLIKEVMPECQIDKNYIYGFTQPGLMASIMYNTCLLYTSPSPRDVEESRMPSSA